MKITAILTAAILTVATATTATANTTIPIPRPPVSGTGRTGMTQQVCLNQAQSVRTGQIRAGRNRKQADAQWVRSVAQCKKLPAGRGGFVPQYRNAPQTTIGVGVR